MNYLAHIYLADLTKTSLCGNFIGDFVKGDIAETDLSFELKQGVYLHRKIDVFTDSHRITRQSRCRISAPRRRYAGIIIDMAFDHFLARNWRDFSPLPLDEFTQKFHLELNQNYQQLPPPSQNIVKHLIKDKWLLNYASIAGIDFALNGIGRRMQKRFNRENTLNNAIEEITSNFTLLEKDFQHFFPELIDYVKQLKL